MISKNRLFIVLCVLTLTTLSIVAFDNHGDLKGESFNLSPWAALKEKYAPRASNPKETPQQPQKKAAGISSWDASTALLYNAATSIISPSIHYGLRGISAIMQMASDSLTGDENKETRDNISTVIAAGLAARGAYAWWHGVPFFGHFLTNWFNNSAYPKAKNIFKKTKVVNINDPD